MSINGFIKRNYLIASIMFVALFLRIYMLGQFPIHLTNDEAALGYNAFSILQTGRDEHGELLPIVFKSFGDWKPGLYVYLTVPFVAMFGLNEFSTRLPSALLGVLAVFLVYIISKRLFDKKVALFSSFALTTMPWHINFSRGAWEANAALTILLMAIVFLIHSSKNKIYLIISALLFAMTLWTYQSAKVASVLPLLAYAIAYRQKIVALPRKFVGIAVLMGVIFSIPIILSVFAGKGGRLEVMSVFSYPRPENYIQQTVFDHEEINKNGPIYLMFHTEKLNLARGIIGRYMNYFSGRFLIFEGDWSNPRHTVPDLGYLLFATIPFLIIGICKVCRDLKMSGPHVFLILWFLLAPLPSALTRDSAHGVRALNLAAVLAIIIGMGLASAYEYLDKKNYFVKVFGSLTIAAAFLYSMFLYFDGYFVQSPHKDADDRLYGYKQTVLRVNSLSDKYERIVFDQSFDQPYIFFLFFNKYNPKQYQDNTAFVEGSSGDVGFVRKLEKVEFRLINWSADKHLANTLLVGKVLAFPPTEVQKEEDYSVDVVKYPNGLDAFLLVDRK